MAKGLTPKQTEARFKKLLTEVNSVVESNKEMAGMLVEVGLPDDRIHEPSGLIMSKIGAMHEFGTGNLPERSFLRGAVLDGRAAIKKAMMITAEKVNAGAAPLSAMGSLALFGQGLVQEYMANGDVNFTPLAKPRKDGSSNPLNDTGSLRQGIIGVVVSD